MSLLEVIQWLCHGCSCETQLVPSAGLFSHCRWTSGGFNVGKRWWGWHLLSWGHPCRSTCGSPDGHPGELTAPLHLLPQGFFTWHLGWMKVFAGTLELQDHCCSVSRGQLAAPVTGPMSPAHGHEAAAPRAQQCSVPTWWAVISREMSL